MNEGDDEERHVDLVTSDYYLTDLDTTYPYKICHNNGSDFNFSAYSVYCNVNFTFPNYINPAEGIPDDEDLQKVVSIVVPFLFSIIFFVGLFGNFLVVITIVSNKQMHNTTNILILNLAMADLLFVIFCVPFTASDYVFNGWIFGEIWCKMVQYFIIVTTYVSVYTLVLMSIDRFLAVVYPVPSIRIRNQSNTYLAIAIIWFIVLISCLPAFPAHGLYTYPYYGMEKSSCTFRSSEYNHAMFQIIFMLTAYAIPLAIICLLYFGMLFRLYNTVTSISSNQNIRGKKRVTRMIVVVVSVFAICWLPIQTVLLLKSLNMYEINDVTVAIQITSHVLAYLNSCVNPILYAFLGRDFRNSFKKIFGFFNPNCCTRIHHYYYHIINHGQQQQHHNRPSASTRHRQHVSQHHANNNNHMHDNNPAQQRFDGDGGGNLNAERSGGVNQQNAMCSQRVVAEEGLSRREEQGGSRELKETSFHHSKYQLLSNSVIGNLKNNHTNSNNNNNNADDDDNNNDDENERYVIDNNIDDNNSCNLTHVQCFTWTQEEPMVSDITRIDDQLLLDECKSKKFNFKKYHKHSNTNNQCYYQVHQLLHSPDYCITETV